MPQSSHHTVVVLGLSAVSTEALRALTNEYPLPLSCLFLQSKASHIHWPNYAQSRQTAQEMVCAAARSYRAPLCIGVMHGIYWLNMKPSPNTYSPAAVVEIAVLAEYGKIMDIEVLLNPKHTADALLGRPIHPGTNAEEASRHLVDMVRRRQSALV